MIVSMVVLGLIVGLTPDVPPPQEQTPASSTAVPDDPYARRPACESMFLASEWQLSFKQRSCDWIQNGVFSTSAMLGSVWSAETSPVWDRIAGRADPTTGFGRRFATDFAQNAFKSTGTYLGGLAFQEDPRVSPPIPRDANRAQADRLLETKRTCPSNQLCVVPVR